MDITKATFFPIQSRQNLFDRKIEFSKRGYACPLRKENVEDLVQFLGECSMLSDFRWDFRWKFLYGTDLYIPDFFPCSDPIAITRAGVYIDKCLERRKS